MSSRISSMGLREISSSAVSPSSASRMLWPSFLSTVDSASRMSGSSSTTRIRDMSGQLAEAAFGDRAAVGGRDQAQVAGVAAQDLARDGQPEAGPAGLGAEERPHQIGHHRRVDSRAVVLD